MTEQELKPCPFCGSKRIGLVFSLAGYQCYCTSPLCSASVSRCFVIKADAIAAWNRRAEEPE